MSDSAVPNIPPVKIKIDNLYLEESFTDMTFATLRRYTPVKVDGTIDENREVIFIGMTQLMSPKGPVPVQCVIEGATNLSDAAARLPEAMEKEVKIMIAEAQELQRQESTGTTPPRQ